MAIEIDLYSDTLTKPSDAMRRFMCAAEVGDEQKGEDPTVNLLTEMVAELLGKEAAVFLPSGTMCNEISLRVHCRPGDEMIAHRTAHSIHFEGGGPAALAGSREFIEEAWRCKQQMGGAMRQAGIIAAAGVYALKHNVERLAEDHANARRLAEGLADVRSVDLDPTTVETNIVIFELTGELDAPGLVERLLDHGVRMGAMGPRTVRAVTHLDVDPEQIERAIVAARAVLAG